MNLRVRVQQLVSPGQRVHCSPEYRQELGPLAEADESCAEVRVLPLDRAARALPGSNTILIAGDIDRAVEERLQALRTGSGVIHVLLAAGTLRLVSGGYEVLALAAGTSARDLQAALRVPLFAAPGLSEL